MVFGFFYINFYTFVHIFLFQTQKNRPPTSWLKLVLWLSEGRLCTVKYWLVNFCYTRRLQEVSSSINSSSVAEGVKSLTGVFFWTKIKSDVPTPHLPPPSEFDFLTKGIYQSCTSLYFFVTLQNKSKLIPVSGPLVWDAAYLSPSQKCSGTHRLQSDLVSLCYCTQLIERLPLV